VSDASVYSSKEGPISGHGFDQLEDMAIGNSYTYRLVIGDRLCVGQAKFHTEMQF